MTTSVFHRRRMERLAQLLEDSRSTHDPQLAGYVRLTDALTESAGVLPGPTPEFRVTFRAQLMATAEREGIGSAAVDDEPAYVGRRARTAPPLVTRGRVKGAILVGLAAGTLALSGMSAASGNAMPGDPLYGVKRSTETARLALTGSDIERGRLHLEFAHNRLQEASAIGPRGTGLAGMLDAMDAETRDGVRLLTTTSMARHDRTGLDLVDAFVPQQRADLMRLGDSARIRQSLALLDQISTRSGQLRPLLACASAPSATDALGAVPRPCAAGGPTMPGTTGGSRTESTNPGAPGASTSGPATSHDPSVGPSASPSGGLLGDLGKILGGGQH
jgi:hypothetical protein